MESASTLSWTSEISSSSMPGRIPTACPRRYERHKSAKDINRKENPLLMCIELNYIEELENILEANGKNYTQDKLDQSLFKAAASGKSEACRLLINAGSDPSAFESPTDHQERHKTSGLFPFIPEHGQQDSWLKAHTSVGGSVLHRAVENGHMRTAQVLLQSGSSVNAKDRNGLTALMIASMKRGNHNLVHLLTLMPGCDVRACDNITKKTALHYAAECGDAFVVKLLLDNGANVNDRDAKQNIPLILVLTPTNYEHPKWPVRQTVECAQLLIEYGSFVNTYNVDNHTPISFAVAADLDEVVELLLQKNAVVSNEILKKACLHVNDDKIVEMLLRSTHTFEDEFLCSLLAVVISIIESKWVFNARDHENSTHNIAKSIIKAVSDPNSYTTTICTLTEQQLLHYFNEEDTRTLKLQELGTYGLFGYALLKGKFGIAKMLYMAGCRDRLHRLKSNTAFMQLSNEHPFLKTWIPEIVSNLQTEDLNDTNESEQLELFLKSLEIDKVLDDIEPYDDVIHQSGYGMLDMNYLSREKSKAYIATNVHIYT